MIRFCKGNLIYKKCDCPRESYTKARSLVVLIRKLFIEMQKISFAWGRLLAKLPETAWLLHFAV